MFSQCIEALFSFVSGIKWKHTRIQKRHSHGLVTKEGKIISKISGYFRRKAELPTIPRAPFLCENTHHSDNFVSIWKHWLLQQVNVVIWFWPPHWNKLREKIFDADKPVQRFLLLQTAALRPFIKQFLCKVKGNIVKMWHLMCRMSFNALVNNLKSEISVKKNKTDSREKNMMIGS